MNFKIWLEDIDYNSKIVTIPKGQILYHGTIESYDSRKIKTGIDKLFWTTDEPLIARSYIPVRGSYLTALDSEAIAKSANLRKSIGLTDAVVEKIWSMDRFHIQQLIELENKHKEFKKFFDDNYKSNNLDVLDDDFFKNWREVEDKIPEAKNNYMKNSYTNLIRNFVKMKMKRFGYEPDAFGGYMKVFVDKEGHLIPSDEFASGRVLKLICKRDFKMYNQAYGREADLMDLDYKKYDLFATVEEKGFDGIIINDFAQTDVYGNMSHTSIGFFKHVLKDIEVKQIRNQTNPKEEDWPIYR